MGLGLIKKYPENIDLSKQRYKLVPIWQIRHHMQNFDLYENLKQVRSAHPDNVPIGEYSIAYVDDQGRVYCKFIYEKRRDLHGDASSFLFWMVSEVQND
tara:strand:- start:9910 stop:10206 length:297 start_codon:yes stop_codon:yes gene_type:complete